MVAIELTLGKQEKVLLRNTESGYELCWQRVQKGRKVWTPERYYPSIPAALDKVLHLKIAAADVTTLNQLKTAVEEARREIAQEWQGRPDVTG